MERVYAAFSLAPLLVVTAACLISWDSTPFLLFLPMLFVTYVLTFVLALPLFFLFRKIKWLQWWHAAIAGLLIGSVFVLFYVTDVNSYNIEIYGLSGSLNFLTLGFFIAVVFWIIAVFRNAAFPYVSRRFPISLPIVGVLLLVASFYMPKAFATSSAHGEITAVLSPDNGRPVVQVKLESGENVRARVLCYGRYLPGRLVYIVHRKQFLFISEGYWVVGLFDAKSAEELLDQCGDGTAPPVSRY